MRIKVAQQGNKENVARGHVRWISNAPAHQPGPKGLARAILDLQRRYGNRFVGRLLQAKLIINRPGDEYELEADRVADQVMRMVLPEAAGRTGDLHRQDSLLQRKCAECEEEEKEKQLQRKEAPGGAGPPIVGEVLRSPGRPLDAALRAFLEPRFGHDFSQIRVNADNGSARAAEAMDARAFTLGNTIWFGQNEYDPHSPRGLHLLAHELAHTIQQRAQAPSRRAGPRVVRIDDPAEDAADRAADAAMHLQNVPWVGVSGSVIRRHPKNKFRLLKQIGSDTRLVEMDDQIRYRVKRLPRVVRHTELRPFPPKLTPGAEFAKAWIRVEWCRGRIRGHGDIGVDVTDELQRLAQELLQAVSSGGDVAAVLERANLTPYIDVLVAQSGNWLVHLRAETDVGQKGVTAGRLGIRFQTEKVDIGVAGGIAQTPEGKPQWSVGIELREGRKAETFKCPERVKEWYEQVYDYECEKEESPKPPLAAPSPTERVRHVYFCYSTTEVNDNKCENSPRDPNRKSYEHLGRDYNDLNQKNLEGLASDFKEHFQVASVVGYTSPEGPAGPKGSFEGNTPLATHRANAAKDWIIREACSPRKPDECFVGGEKGVTPQGGGSLKDRESHYPDLRRADIRLVPPSATPEVPRKESDFRTTRCPPDVWETAFPPWLPTSTQAPQEK